MVSSSAQYDLLVVVGKLLEQATNILADERVVVANPNEKKTPFRGFSFQSTRLAPMRK